MIHANELRIGNWVHTQNGDVIVTSVDDENHRIGTFGELTFSLSRVDPISLTPELLEKCAFEHEGVTTLTIDKIPIYFKVFKGGIKCFAFYLNSQVEVPCLYVHQLQNLYFALTGTELEIKELTPSNNSI